MSFVLWINASLVYESNEIKKKSKKKCRLHNLGLKHERTSMSNHQCWFFFQCSTSYKSIKSTRQVRANNSSYLSLAWKRKNTKHKQTIITAPHPHLSFCVCIFDFLTRTNLHTLAQTSCWHCQSNCWWQTNQNYLTNWRKYTRTDTHTCTPNFNRKRESAPKKNDVELKKQTKLDHTAVNGRVREYTER